MQYVGFWWRVLAAIVDSICLTIGITVVSIIVGVIVGVMGAGAEGAELVGGLLGFLGYIMYETLFVASGLRATPGKLVIGSVVVKPDGSQLSIPNALGRCFAKYLSSLILLIGYIMVAFTDRKRGLHDMLAGSVVVKKDSLVGQVDPV